jgi:DNA-binding XRE family transcriptional regulator
MPGGEKLRVLHCPGQRKACRLAVKVVAIHQPEYLPWVPYFDKMDRCDMFVHLDTVQFQRRGYQNRNRIPGPRGPLWLSVPVHAARTSVIREVPVIGAHWVRKHIRAMQHVYARAPYRGLIQEELAPLLAAHWQYLPDLCITVTNWMARRLGIACQTVRASELNASGKAHTLIISICKALGADVYLSGVGAQAYQCREDFLREGIELRYQKYRNLSYPQCHSSLFEGDLSALDLIVNTGPEARRTLVGGRLDDP